MIATAISGGDTAPIGSPIGAWMRASFSSLAPCSFQPLDAPAVGFARAERADVEAVALERMQQRRIVDLRVVGQRDERRVAVDAERRQRRVGPLGDHLHVGKALRARERGARIDDGHVIAEQRRDRRQRLAKCAPRR